MSKLMTLLKLRDALNGECGNVCPESFNVDLLSFSQETTSKSQGTYYDNNWSCIDCKEYFYDLKCEIDFAVCPCRRGINKKDLFLKLDEVIETRRTIERKFDHGCSRCIFLGNFKNHDIYYCDGEIEKSFIARYGNDGHEYMSFPIDVIESILERNEIKIEDNILIYAYNTYKSIIKNI